MAKATAVAVRPKIPMAIAATELAMLCDAIEAAEESPNFDLTGAAGAALVMCFQQTKRALADSVDRRITFIKAVEAHIEAARGARNAWDAQKQRLEALLDAMRQKTKEVIEAVTDDEEEKKITFRGSLGAFAVQKNGGPAPMATTWGDRELSAELVDMFGIDERYFYIETTYKLRPEVVLKDLEAGEKIEWAQLAPRGTHLRIKLTPEVAP